MTDSDANDDPPVAAPTWNGNIKGFFDSGDIACMNDQGLDLSSYESVRDSAKPIYDEVKSGNMPAGGPPWSANRVETFANWMSAGFPLGIGGDPDASAAARGRTGGRASDLDRRHFEILQLGRDRLHGPAGHRPVEL
jgi:hypothetical protein